MEKEETIQSGLTMHEQVRRYLKRELQSGITYKAGTLYENMMKRKGADNVNEEVIPYKNFLMVLRLEALREGGILKREAFGVYGLRETPNDRGMVRGKKVRLAALPSQLEELLPNNAVQGDIDLEDLLAEILELTERMKYAFEAMYEQIDKTEEATYSLWKLQKNTMRILDELVTEVTSAVAWREDHQKSVMSSGEQESQIKMGGMS